MDRALVFIDMVDSTERVARIGDAAAMQLWTEHDQLARALLAQHQGREIDRSDGFFLLFDDAPAAAQFALAYQVMIAGLSLRARIGLHLGAVALRSNSAEEVARGAKPIEVEGLAKPLCARIMALARGGQVLASAACVQALVPSLPAGAELDSHGHYRLKGVDTPIEIFELGVRGHSAFTPPADTDKAYRVVAKGELWLPLREIRHNLPAERDAFVGRSAELRALALRLDGGARLVTLHGPGGTGKTRLARRYGLGWLGNWPGGVCFCDLSEARSLDGICFAVAVGLGVPLGKDDPVALLGHAIDARGKCLLILDNFEQVLPHAAPTLGRWLDRAAQASFVVTSRERLHLPGEDLLPIEPLPLDKEAIELFALRAAAHKPGFELNKPNLQAVKRIVRLLDGLPLAIELAAARVRVFSAAQLLERIDDRFRVLAGASGTAPRQATMRAAIDWSWDLLKPWEQAALAQCSVFEGAFTLGAAEAVLDLAPWPDAPLAMEAVESLVDKSLLRTWVPVEQARYDLEEPCFGMYLSIHEYAAQRLVAGGPAAREAAEQRHARYFATFGSDAALEALHGHGGVRKRRELALELDNLVAACTRSVAHRRGDHAVDAYRAAWEVLQFLGPAGLGAALGAQVLALDEIDASRRIAALVTHGQAAMRSGQAKQARASLERAIELSRQHGDRGLEALAVAWLGALQREQSQMDQARELLDRALGMARDIGDRRLEASTLAWLGSFHRDQGRYESSRQHHAAALHIYRELGDRAAEGATLANLAGTRADEGHYEEANEQIHEALAIHRKVGNRRSEAELLGNLGVGLFMLRRFDEALTHYEAALAVHREVGNRRFEGIALQNIGLVLDEQRRRDEARAHFELALAIHREVGNRRLEGFVTAALGLLHLDLGQIDLAQAQVAEALAIHRDVGDRFNLGVGLIDLADILVRQGRLDEAAAALDEGVPIAQAFDEGKALAKAHWVRAQAAVARGDDGAARSALAEATKLAAASDVAYDSELALAITALSDRLH